MVNLLFEKLDPIKLPLLQRFYKQHYPSKPKKDELIIVARKEGAICGAVRFRTIDQFRLLTGMAVDEDLRGNGIGHQLLDYCQHQEPILNPEVYCFAFPWLVNFYQQHGFQVIETEQLPPSLRSLYQRYLNSGKSLVAMQYQTENSHI